MSGFKRRGGGGDGGKGKVQREEGSPDEMNGGSDDEDAGLAFEDPFEDEFEEEEVVDEDEDEDEDEDDEDDEGAGAEQGGKKKKSVGFQDDEAAAAGGQPIKQVWRPGIDQLEEGETLEYDPSAYVMYHQIGAEWPCLSFDILRDTLGDARSRFPHTMFMVTGSQADRPENNKITLLSLRELHKTYHDDDGEDSDGEDDDDLDEDPVLDHVNIPHRGGVNRVRSCPQQPGLVATMADDGKAHVYDVGGVLNGLMTLGAPAGVVPKKPAFTFQRHTQEGYALDWSPREAGRLATGDCAGHIHVWQMSPGGGGGGGAPQWSVDPTPYAGHRGSVEDIQWSPTEGTVFISSSTDRTYRIWDIRAKTAQISVEAHSEDVNVLSWSRTQSYLLASGCDDGSFKVWDLRAVRESRALAHFTYHKGPITSIEWAPHDESVLCASSADNQVTVWDLSVEADEGEVAAAAAAAAAAGGGGADLTVYPPQLLFIHQGQSNVKELHHHPHIPGVVVTTAEDGFNVFKPAISVQA